MSRHTKCRIFNQNYYVLAILVHKEFSYQSSNGPPSARRTDVYGEAERRILAESGMNDQKNNYYSL